MLRNIQITLVSVQLKMQFADRFSNALFAIASVNEPMGRLKPAPLGMPNEIQITPYKTTMIADGKDEALINVKIIDSKGDSLPNAHRLVAFHIKGDSEGLSTLLTPKDLEVCPIPDPSTWQVNLTGSCRVILQTGRTRGIVKFEAKADSLWTGSTEIHTVQPGIAHVVTRDKYAPKKVTGKILGADISFLPQLESRGMKFSDNGVLGDAIEIMKAHGFNYIRLRIFNEPANPKGYSPKQGFCDLEHTKQMAKRIKAAGMKFLLDFHYSDYWADPQQQNKPRRVGGRRFYHS